MYTRLHQTKKLFLALYPHRVAGLDQSLCELDPCGVVVQPEAVGRSEIGSRKAESPERKVSHRASTVYPSFSNACRYAYSSTTGTTRTSICSPESVG